jgi:ferredoxin-fold anticodon binding domain-containing protein
VGGKEMKDLLQMFVGKLLRIYTISGIESYLDILEEVKDDYIVLKGYFKGDRTYLAINSIESFKEEPKKN